MTNNTTATALLERTLLATIIMEPETFKKVEYLISANNFSVKNNLQIFSILKEISLQGKELEISIIVNELAKTNNSVDWASYISDLVTNVRAYPSNITNLAKEIHSNGQLRELRVGIDSIGKKIDGRSITFEEAINKLEDNIVSLSTSNKNSSDYMTSSDAFNQSLANIKLKRSNQEATGLKSNFVDLDQITLGFQNGDLIIVAARPSMGKTAFALNLATNIAIKKNVLFFSIEMPTNQLMNRIISSKYGIAGNILKDPKSITSSHWNAIWAKLENDHQNFGVSKLNLYIDDTGGIEINDLVWKAKRIHENLDAGLHMIVVDYMQLINSTTRANDNRQNEVALISRALKKLARDLDIPVVALSQLSRRVEQRESKVPIMSDLRESGAIEQDADLIMFLYRDSYYEKMKGKEVNDSEDLTDVIIAKHRNGATGIARLKFEPEYSKFENTTKY